MHIGWGHCRTKAKRIAKLFKMSLQLYSVLIIWQTMSCRRLYYLRDTKYIYMEKPDWWDKNWVYINHKSILLMDHCFLLYNSSIVLKHQGMYVFTHDLHLKESKQNFVFDHRWGITIFSFYHYRVVEKIIHRCLSFAAPQVSVLCCPCLFQWTYTSEVHFLHRGW